MSDPVSMGRARPPAEPSPTLPQRKPLGHSIPSWVSDGSCFFITICTERRGCDDLIREGRASEILKTVAHLQERKEWFVRLFLIMPDHVHGLISFPSQTVMQKRISSWKGYLAKTLQIQWQDRFFDHRLRSDGSLDEKAHYIRMNPVRAGLSKTPEDWPWMFDGFRFDHGSAGMPRPTHSPPSYV